MLWSIESCQNMASPDQYHVTISLAQVLSSSRSHVFLKLTADQVLAFAWIMVSSQVNLLISTGLFRRYNFIVFMLCSLRLLKLKTEVQTLTAMLQNSNKYSHLSWVRLLLDYSNQGHLIKFSTNLIIQIILVIKLFITKATDFWSFWIILENHC